ncbi:hypothetical protein KIK04_11235 [Paenibacillus sp. 481]|nr:hypothetical protein KIK04_11235 [Paenibacillus sp. 481]
MYIFSYSDSINYYERKWFSQNGEDGIIEELFARIGTTNKMFVEIGVQHGLESNTAYLSRHKQWTGYMVEANPFYYEQLCHNFAAFRSVRPVHYFVDVLSVNKLFEAKDIPYKFDLLSIDIDGNDYWIWGALLEYRPRVVVIEYNASFLPPKKMVVQYDPQFIWDGTSHFGASLSSLAELGRTMGYSLIGTESRGVNAFFVRNDLVEVSRFRALTAEEAYHLPDYGPDQGGHPRRDGPYLEI